MKNMKWKECVLAHLDVRRLGPAETISHDFIFVLRRKVAQKIRGVVQCLQYCSLAGQKLYAPRFTLTLHEILKTKTQTWYVWKFQATPNLVARLLLILMNTWIVGEILSSLKRPWSVLLHYCGRLLSDYQFISLISEHSSFESVLHELVAFGAVATALSQSARYRAPQNYQRPHGWAWALLPSVARNMWVIQIMLL